MAVGYFFNIFYACIKLPSRFFSRDGGFLFAIIPYYPLKFKGIMGYNRFAKGEINVILFAPSPPAVSPGLFSLSGRRRSG